jgi:hypothetical protein
MNVDMRGMRAGLAVASVAAILWSIAGCGGSGSSGFDVAPLTTEPQAIARAIDTEQCIAFDQQTFCASGVEPDAGTFQGASVTIQAPEDPLVCDGRIAGAKCTASLEFTTEGFTVPNSLLAAVSQSEDGPWTMVPLTVTEDVTGPRTVSITVPGRTDADNPTPLIAAVLVYLGPVPDPAPQTVAHLADFGVDLVYVSPRLEIVVPR